MQATFKQSILAFIAGLALAGTALASDRVDLADGSRHAGDVLTRNGPVRIGNDVEVQGAVETRNGAVRIGDLSRTGAVSSRNGAIAVGNGNRLGEVSTRNGSIELGAGNEVKSLDTRNGSITVGSGSRVDGLVHTRNGSIRLAEAVEVSGSVSTRNGRIQLGRDTRVAGQLESRNGAIHLDQAEVGQEVLTRAGDIELRSGSRVGGDLQIELAELSGGWRIFGGRVKYSDAGHIRILDDSVVEGDVIIRLPSNYNGETPSITVGPDARVVGRVRVDSRVELDIQGEVGGGVQQR